MRILALMNLDVFRMSLGWALESLGHDVFYIEDLNEQTMELAVNKFQPDLMLDMGWDVWHGSYYGGWMERQREIKERYGIFHVYFAEEDWLHYEIWSSKYCSIMKPDFVLTRGRSTIDKHVAAGFPTAWFDVGCNPEFHRPVPATKAFACDVSVLVNGQFSWDIFRRKSIADLIIPLFDQPFDTRIWGREWEDVVHYYGVSPRPGMLRGRLAFHYSPYVYSSAKINISVQSVEDQISNRTYDILSCGGFLLTSDTPAVRERMTPGVHCEVSSSPEETVEKISWYLKHDDQREAIARNGMMLAHEKFAYQKTWPGVWPAIVGEWQRKKGKGVEAS